MIPGSVYPDKYNELWKIKSTNIVDKFNQFSIPHIEFYTSIKQHFRMRAEFRVWHDKEAIHYAMFAGDKKEIKYIKDFPIASERINQLMHKLMSFLENNTILSKRLFQVEFLTATTGQAIVTLIYHKKLDNEWLESAKRIEKMLNAHIIGRAKKQKIIISQDYIVEKFNINGHLLQYMQPENGFTQPNAVINQKLLSWVDSITDTPENNTVDLIELYCGNGNFTCVLAKNFNSILATEISKVSVNAAKYNFEANDLSNVHVVRMSSEELMQGISHVRKFRRLAFLNLDDFKFTYIFVDPPRAGLDETTLNLVKKFDKIIYVSCNPQTLYRDICVLHKSHTTVKMALFDQFPYTDHTEVGVLLQKI